MADNQVLEIKIKRINPDNVRPTHVNDMLVSHDGKEFFIQFFEIEPPALLEAEDLKKLKSIDAIMKVKLVMSPEFTEAVIRALSETMAKYKARNLDHE